MRETNQPRGLLNSEILEFLRKSKTDVVELKDYLLRKYNLNVSNSVLENRMRSLEKLQ